MSRIPPYTQMTLKWLREQGYMAEVVEKWVKFQDDQENKSAVTNPKAKGFRKDLWGWIDIIAISPHETLAVQATSGAQRTEHIEKIHANENFNHWMCGPGRRAILVTWTKKLVKRGGKAKRWSPRITELTGTCPF